MKIINLIHIGDKVYNFNELPEKRKTEIAKQLNEQAFKAIGCKIKTV